MTIEKYNRIVDIHNRLSELNDADTFLKRESDNRLCYCHRNCNNGFSMNPEWFNNSLSDILDRHDKQIRQEIIDEIVRLQKEVEDM